MSYETQLTDAERVDLTNQLESAEWPSIAEDLAEGHSPETVLNRLYEIGESDSEAASIIRSFVR